MAHDHSHAAHAHDHGHDHAHGDARAHSHDHGHSHHHEADERNAARIGIAAILTGAFMGVELAGGLFAGSLALIADAGHMLSDFGSLALAWIGFLDEAELGGCLALDMGLGKTPTVLAHLARTEGDR